VQTKKCAPFPMLQLVYGRFLPQEVGQGKIEAVFSWDSAPTRSRAITMTVLILLLGLFAGVMVGLLGIGGGVVLVPAMVYLLHMDQHMAQGTSLFILLPPVGLGAWREYWKQGQVDLKAGILCALGMLVGAYAGSLIALLMAARHLKGMFGCFLMLSAVLLWRKTQLESRADNHAGEKPHV
jgi:uncharacterized membrane protein YfcA